MTSSCADPDRARDYLRHAAPGEMEPEYALFDAAHAHSRPLPRIPELPALVDVLNELVDAVVWRGEPVEPALAAAQRAAERLVGARAGAR